VSEANHASFYYTVLFFNAILVNRRFKDERDWRFENAEKPPYNSYAKSVDIAYGALAGTEANLEFLAIVLHQEEKLVVATPLFGSAYTLKQATGYAGSDCEYSVNKIPTGQNLRSA